LLGIYFSGIRERKGIRRKTGGIYAGGRGVSRLERRFPDAVIPKRRIPLAWDIETSIHSLIPVEEDERFHSLME
jgi:hypothetical protein